MNRRSLRIEIVAGFATLVAALAMMGGYALVRQTRAVEALRLQNQGFLPLSLALSDAKANQNSMDTILERLLEVQDRAAWRTWVTIAVHTRSGVILKARSAAQEARRYARAPEDLALLDHVDATLRNVERTYRDDERDFGTLFDALSSGDIPRARGVQHPLFEREHGSEYALAQLTREVAQRIDELVRAAALEQPKTLRVLSVITAVALATGLLTLLTAIRALRPLALLIERVRAVASGDLSPRKVPARADEIGELAREFDNMVDAVKARDTALREKADEIRRAEQHLEQVVATLRAAVMVVGRDGRVRSANPAAVRLADGASLVDANFRETPFGGVTEIAENVEATCAGTRPSASLLALPMGGRALDVAIATFVAPNEQGSGALVVADDVTEREEARAQLLQNERLAAIGRMAAHVTHEVRNPLSSMALNAEMLADEARGLGPPGREVERLVGAIQREIDRLTGITEEYLRVARLPRPRLEREDVVALVQETLSFVTAEFKQAGIELQLLPDGEIPAAMLDEAQIRQALLNLLRNAREAVEAHRGDARRVRIGIAPARGGVEITLADSGPGIRAEVRPHLFELFFTTKERGSGLGLPLTREIVRAHGGTIDVTDARTDEGGGAKFVIWLPASPAHTSAPAHGGTLDAA